MFFIRVFNNRISLALSKEEFQKSIDQKNHRKSPLPVFDRKKITKGENPCGRDFAWKF
jgi:hypothetical protein